MLHPRYLEVFYTFPITIFVLLIDLPSIIIVWFIIRYPNYLTEK
jgi:hypothetical protein